MASKAPAFTEPTIYQREQTINNVVGKFYSRLDNKCFAKAEGQIAM